MPSLWAGYVNILKLDEATLQVVKESRDGFWFALKLFVIVGLVVGLGKLIDGANVLQQPTLPGIVHDVAAGLESVAVALPPVLAAPLLEVTTAVTDLETTLSQFQPPLGKGVSRFIRLVGDWLSTPLTMMANLAPFHAHHISVCQGAAWKRIARSAYFFANLGGCASSAAVIWLSYFRRCWSQSIGIRGSLAYDCCLDMEFGDRH